MNIEVNPEIFLTYRARDIQTRMDDNPICVDINESASSAFQKLKMHGFDQAPVVSQSIVIGHVLSRDLENAKDVKSIFTLLSPDDLISADAPLNTLLKRLVDKGLIYIVGKNGIEGFVVPSDIGRHVSRAHLYLLISGLEILMTRIVSRENLDLVALKSAMSPDSLKAYEKELSRGFEANPVEYLSLTSLGKLMKSFKEPLVYLEVKQEQWTKYIGKLGKLRNWVAHSNTEQITKYPFSEIVGLIQDTETFIRKLNTY